MNTPQNTPQNTPAPLKNAYEYTEMWRKKHDALWVANQVWGYVLEGWRGFSVEEYQLNAQEAAFYQAQTDAQVAIRKAGEERAEKQRLAIETRQKAVKTYVEGYSV